MFSRFRQRFPRETAANHSSVGAESDYPRLSRFLREFGGSSFRGGLYRTVSFASLTLWDQRIATAYPDYEGRVTCFAYDWLGRAFALDWNRLEAAEPGVLMFELGTGYALQVPRNLESFHELELTDFAEQALALSFFEHWLDSGGRAPAQDECIGYRKPLFLGGEDELSNLERVDLDVYWHVVGQLAAAARGKPPGSILRV
jgi:hypothetical protein